MTGNKPETQERAGAISLAVFNGQYGKSLVLQKSWLPKDANKDDKDAWKRSNINIFLNELPKVKEVVDKIFEQYKQQIEEQQKKKEETQ